MNKRLYYLIPLVIAASVLLALGGLSIFKTATTPKHMHYHAGFKVYADNKLQDFSKAQYMKENPCTVDGKPTAQTSKEEEQLEKAHLHDRVGNVVHSHRDNVYWSDFFTNIKYTLPKDKPIKTFMNGKEIKEITKTKINPYDSVVILVGENTDYEELSKKAVTKDEILKAESKSESCGS